MGLRPMGEISSFWIILAVYPYDKGRFWKKSKNNGCIELTETYHKKYVPSFIFFIKNYSTNALN